MASEKGEATPPQFPFPFPPYPIQTDFMRSLYRCLDLGHFGIFESPTGTGKSLSMICGTLTWFRDFQKKRKLLLQEKLESLGSKKKEENSGDDWFEEAVKKKGENEERLKVKEELDALAEKEARMEELRRRRKSVHRATSNKLDSEFDELFKECQEVQDAVRKELLLSSSRTQDQDFDEQDEEILVEEYFSEEDEDQEGNKKNKNKKNWGNGFDDDEEEKEDFSVRIYYCSRTHSQLSQFVKEIQKSPFSEDVRLVALASRNNMCVYDEVKRLGSNSLVNEKCLDLQKKGSSKSKKNDEEEFGDPVAKKPQRRKRGEGGAGPCPYFNQGRISALRDRALLQVLDIEQLASAGRQVKGCPYYASRNAVDDAQIIVLPYNTLLHKPTREAVGIKLKGSVVIVDEAHNLMDTISHIHGMEVSGKHLCHAHSQLSQYLERYKSRLKAKNLLYIRQIIFILANLIKYVGGKAGKDPEQSVPESSKMILPHVLMVDSEIFNLNIFKIIRYVERSKIAQKLLGFNEKYNGQVASTTANKAKENNSKGVNAFLQSIKNKKSKEASEENEVSENVKKPSSTVNSPLLMIVEFLQALTNTKSEARILVSTQGGSLARSSLKYILMNPASQFTDLVRDCRSIIVAGGTMQPISEFKQQLFLGAGASEERISHFSCGHVTPKENILPLVLQAGPTGRTLDFTFENRNKPEIMNELFLVLLNMSNIIPGGIVCFFPSYDYEARLFDFWEKSGMTAKLNAKKKLFREPKRSDEMDKVLKDYSRSANGKSGAILLSVVGGKMSEGINFSDDLGRCVVMVGLPFPNSKSPELKEKMSYLNKTVSADEGGAGRLPGQVHYENLCMKAVNQSIGRAIRHKADYASILLLDHRYKRPNIRGQLPGWIQEHVQVMEKFGLSVPAVRKFFKAKET